MKRKSFPNERGMYVIEASGFVSPNGHASAYANVIGLPLSRQLTTSWALKTTALTTAMVTAERQRRHTANAVNAEPTITMFEGLARNATPARRPMIIPRRAHASLMAPAVT